MIDDYKLYQLLTLHYVRLVERLTALDQESAQLQAKLAIVDEMIALQDAQDEEPEYQI
jgi:CHASE3 domain sensor protein